MKNVIENGGDFAALATQFSEDPGSKDEGGLYEGVTPGQFVKPYDDVIFRTGNLRELYSVRTTYGVHLVQVLSRSQTSAPSSPAGAWSATGAAASYLWSRGLIENASYVAEQGHGMGRPGQAFVEVLGPPDAITGVRVGGRGVVVMSGTAYLD